MPSPEVGHNDPSPETPLTDLQLALSKAVDLARKLPADSVDIRYFTLCRTYVDQIMGGVFQAVEKESK